MIIYRRLTVHQEWQEFVALLSESFCFVLYFIYHLLKDIRNIDIFVNYNIDPTLKSG